MIQVDYPHRLTVENRGTQIGRVFRADSSDTFGSFHERGAGEGGSIGGLPLPRTPEKVKKSITRLGNSPTKSFNADTKREEKEGTDMIVYIS